MGDDWDLHAVVRGCAAANSTSTSTSTTTVTACSLDFHLPSTSFQSQEEDLFLFFSDPFGLGRSRERTEDLHDLFEPSFPKLQPIFPQNTSISSPLPVLGRLQDLSPPQQERQQPQQEKQPQNHSVGGAGTISSSNSTGNTPSSRSKRRKQHQLKRVCEIPAEALSSDTWFWRKYGQKPIKGSPYPRGYYKCSTSKGCSARKQVERSRSDPGIFTVTYTGEHNHPVPTNRNSLAGITHQKLVTRETSSSPPVSPMSFSPVSEKTESREEREDIMDDGLEDDVGVPDTGISDDFFEGLEEIAGRLTGDRFTDEVPASLAFLWGVHNATTTAAGSG